MKNFSILKLAKSYKAERYLNKLYLNYGLAASAFVLGIYLNWSLQNIILFCALICFILFPRPSQFYAKIALFCLVLTPILLIVNRESRAEDIAVIAYFALVAAVIVETIEFKKLGKKKNGKQ